MYKNFSKLCLTCTNVFTRRNQFTSWRQLMEKKYCSRECWYRGLSEYNKSIGRVPPNALGRVPSAEQKLKIGATTRRSWSDPELRQKMRAALTGAPKPNNRGPNNNLWKGGVTPINRAIRTSLKYKQWRRAVFERDRFTCQLCGQVGGKLEADHIKAFATHPDLRTELTNGRTLCKPCHEKTPNYKGRKIKTI